MSSTGSKLWSGRFTKSTDRSVETFTASIFFDWQLYREDIIGSAAHARMLNHCGILTQDEANSILSGLKEVLAEFESGDIKWDAADEDIHMLVEKELRKRCGSIAGKLHTARSRNDQVALDTHLYVRGSIIELSASLTDLVAALANQARLHLETYLPGYTHLQRAQPIVFGHHLLAYCWMFLRDIERLRDLLPRVNILPLGAGALAGTTFPIDRRYVAQQLVFDAIYDNSIDAVSDRDYMVELLATLSLTMTHLSRLSEELVLWCSSEFGFIELDDGYCTGSSIMPQKKNPDVAELIRGKTGRVYGSLTAILTLLKGLPLAYNKDMQEDKEGLFDGVNTSKSCIQLMKGMIESMVVRKERMLAATRDGFLNATDLADYLVNKGLPFRDAHEVAGKAVRLSIEKNCTLEDLSLAELKSLSDLISEDVFSALTIDAVVRRRGSEGATGPDQVRIQLERARSSLRAQQLWVTSATERYRLPLELLEEIG